MEASSSNGSETSNILWQDELCLQPFKSYPGFSQLCNLCIQLFRAKESYKSGSGPHVEFLSTLEESAGRGCRLCNLILEWFREAIQAKAITRVSLRYKLKEFPFLCTFESPSKQHQFLSVHSFQAEEILASRCIYPLKQDIEGNTSSESNRTMARWWFKRCRNHHPQCMPAGYSRRKFPKRLLEVGISFNGPTVKVVETQLLQDIEYMTLSHCWGGSLPLRLLNANLQAYKTSISFSSLPKTFQHALFVVGWFGIKYLWIDALCIIQDSENDWAHESGCMRDYYKYSFGTIAATGASNPSEGLFFDRNPAFVPPFRAIIEFLGKERDVVVTGGDSCLDTLRKEPLNQRGWFLQERFLSPRILYFGRNQMTWECRNGLSCETWPNIVPEDVSRGSFSLEREYSPLSPRPHTRSYKCLWRNLVDTYSSMALTRLSDKCVAFAGIAEEFQAATEDEYVAGLWRRDLPRALLWTVKIDDFGEQRHLNHSPARSRSYLAPSWSWLSINRAVESAMEVYEPLRDMVAINAEVESVTENKFGAIKHGVISGRGALVPAICMAYNEDWCFDALWCFLSIRSKIISETDEWYHIRVDEGYIEEPNGFLYCLPILESRADSLFGQVHGLLVVPTLQIDAQYRRIGTFTMETRQAYDHFKFPRRLRDWFDGPEFQDFTLV